MKTELAKQAIMSSHLGMRIQTVCLELADIVESIEPHDGSFLTLTFFGERVKDAHLSELVSGLNVLSSIDGAILEMHAYIDGFEGPIVVPDEEFRSFLADGILVHPDEGEPLESPEDHIHLFYSIAADVVAEKNG